MNTNPDLTTVSTNRSSHPIRARWAALGAAVAVTLGAGSVGLIHASAPAGASAYVPIAPCRLADTRPDTNVGPHNTPLGPDVAVTYDGWGDVAGGCDLPGGTTALQLNVTAVGATQLTNIRFYPTGGTVPTTSSLNPAPGQPPTPNAVTVTLNADGRFDVFNRFGSVDVVIDVAGVYTDHDHDDRYYTKAQTDAAISAASGGAVGEVYTKTETDQAIADATAGKANTADVYTQAQTDQAIADATAGKANSADVYTQTETDQAIATAVSAATGAVNPVQQLVIPSSAFRGADGTVDVTFVNGAYPLSDAGMNTSLIAPLQLPVGSTITEITYYFRDTSTKNVQIALAEFWPNGNIAALVAGTQVTSIGTNGIGSATVSNLAIVVTGHEYNISALAGTWATDGANLAVKGAVVTYTLP